MLQCIICFFRAAVACPRRKHVPIWIVGAAAFQVTQVAAKHSGLTINHCINHCNCPGPFPIPQALAAAHADEELQSDAAQPQVQEAIEALRKDPSKYEQYAGEEDGIMMISDSAVAGWGPAEKGSSPSACCPLVCCFPAAAAPSAAVPSPEPSPLGSRPCRRAVLPFHGLLRLKEEQCNKF